MMTVTGGDAIEIPFGPRDAIVLEVDRPVHDTGRAMMTAYIEAALRETHPIIILPAGVRLRVLHRDAE